MATGGGGVPARGLKLLKEAIDEGLYPKWVDVESVPDSTITTMVGVQSSSKNI